MARKDVLLRLHVRLVTRRDALRKALSGDMDSLRLYNSTFAVGDSVDAAIDSANDEISTQLAELESRELEQIERALDRIGRGVYGRCEFCGERIAEARLNALPYTNTCIDCQRENERQGDSYGQRTDSNRWANLAHSRMDDGDHEHDIKLSDFEMDLSESGR